MVHSDQGFQRRHASWQRMLADAGVTQFMSRMGNCLDDAVMENFFGHLKESMIRHQEHTSTEAFTAELGDYIHWYTNASR